MKSISTLLLIALVTLFTACNREAPTVTQAPETRVVLVSGATGRQGGAVTRELLDRGYTVRALTRNPSSERAQELQALGAELVKGDFDDRESIDSAVQGVYGVFSVQQWWGQGVEAEQRQGINFADAAKAAGVEHFVYASVASANKSTGIPHFDSKYAIEQHIRSIELPYTMLRPVSFMGWDKEEIASGKFVHALRADKPQQYIAVRDIGMFAAEVFDNPEKWLGHVIDIASDELTMTELAELFSKVTGNPVEYVQAPWSQLEPAFGTELTIMFKWFDNVGYSADIDGLRSEFELTSVEQYLIDSGW